MARYILHHFLRVAVDYVVEKFGRLTTIGPPFLLPVGRHSRACSFQVCVCSCGSGCTLSRVDDLRNGRILSCGCLKIETTKKNSTRHGQANSDEFKIWTHIEQRCNNPKRRGYHNYGGRGIKICEAWTSKLQPRGVAFQNFIKHVGSRPSKNHSIDRFPDKDGNYEPGNVRWATRQEQANNTRRNHMLTFKGESKTISLWAKDLSIPSKVIHGRLSLGWSVDDALGIPPNRGLSKDSITYMGEKITWAELASLHGILADTLIYRVKHGWSLEEALTTPVRKKKPSH